MALTGSFLAGRNDAHGRVYGGGGRVRPRRMVLGWTLFGTGLAAIVITRIPFAEIDDARNAVVRDVGFLGGMMLAVPGAVLGGYAAGYANTMRRVKQLSLAPVAGRGFVGASISGRF